MTKSDQQLIFIERQMQILSRIHDYEKEIYDFVDKLGKLYFDNNLYNIIILRLEIMYDYAMPFEKELLNVCLANFKAVRDFWRDDDYKLLWESIRIAQRQISILKQRLEE